MNNKTSISIFGLGYVGCVTAACLAQRGHSVVVVEPQQEKVDLLNDGKSPVSEPALPELIEQVVNRGGLRATTDPVTAVNDSQLSLICVGTPGEASGKLDLSAVFRAATEIGRILRRKEQYHVVAVRSTVLPGSTRVAIKALEDASGKRTGEDFGVAVNPEFLREGCAVRDFEEPARIIIGEFDKRSGDSVASVYEGLQAPLVRTTLETAEVIKYADNAFHALKIAFANEIGNFCKESNLDGREVMEIFAQDLKLNLSSAYLRPGPPFGGSCLPKDLRAIISRAHELGVELPVLSSILKSNERQKEIALEMVIEEGRHKIGVLGLTFKEGTDDLRESMMVGIIGGLMERGFLLRAYDRNLLSSKFYGSNLKYIEDEIPYLPEILCNDIEELISSSEVLVIGTRDPEFKGVISLARENQTVIDLVGLLRPCRTTFKARYRGICW